MSLGELENTSSTVIWESVALGAAGLVLLLRVERLLGLAPLSMHTEDVTQFDKDGKQKTKQLRTHL